MRSQVFTATLGKHQCNAQDSKCSEQTNAWQTFSIFDGFYSRFFEKIADLVTIGIGWDIGRIKLVGSTGLLEDICPTIVVIIDVNGVQFAITIGIVNALPNWFD